MDIWPSGDVDAVTHLHDLSHKTVANVPIETFGIFYSDGCEIEPKRCHNIWEADGKRYFCHRHDSTTNTCHDPVGEHSLRCYTDLSPEEDTILRNGGVLDEAPSKS